MAEDRAKAKRCSLPKIDTSSTTPPTWQAAAAAATAEQSSKKGEGNASRQPGSGRPHTLQEQILDSVATSLSLSPSRLRESLSVDRYGATTPQSSGDPITDSTPLLEDLTIQTKVLAGSKTLADMETKLIPASAHSMVASVVDPSADDDSESETESESEVEVEVEAKSESESNEQVEKEVMPEQDDSSDDDDDNDVDDVDMRSASIMIAPEKIHRASRMETTGLRGWQDFDKHVRMPSADEPPPMPMPMASFDKPGEVELFLGSERAVSKVVVLRPRAGLFEDRMVACLTLSSISPTQPEPPRVELISPSHMFFAGTQIATIKQRLRNSCSTKLGDESAIPDVWIPLDSMPTVPETDEIDRRRLRTWVQNANQDIYERVRGLVTDQPLSQPADDMERAVQRLVARVLQVPPEQVGMNFSFGQLGGDEVAAMALVTNARMESIFLESHEILNNHSNTLAHLAALATQRGGLAHKWTTSDDPRAAVDGDGDGDGGGAGASHEDDDDDNENENENDNRIDDNNNISNDQHPPTPTAPFFDLSPMQKLYFSTNMGGDAALRGSTDGSYRFNSSLLFRVAKGLSIQDISAATDAVVGHHAMLRARFARVKGEWMQRVAPTVAGSYSFMHYTISTNQQVETVVQTTQAAINVEEGPVFAVAHFQTTDGHQLLYLAAHHLVVDVASWRLVINDMEELLQQGTLLSQRAMPFQTWTQLQKRESQTLSSSDLPFQISPGDLDYWGLRDSASSSSSSSSPSPLAKNNNNNSSTHKNTYADANEASFSLSEELTSILETTCNQVLRTDSVDIYIAALMLSFAQTFPDRGVPDVWNQEVGRDLWSGHNHDYSHHHHHHHHDVDISETVGWFTTLCPLHQQIYASSDFVDVLRRLKDTRRAVPHRGAHYFASKFFAAADTITTEQPAASSSSSPSSSPSPRARSPQFLQIATQEWPIEILFSHAGEIKNLGRDNNGLLEQIALPGRTIGSHISDIGPAVGRIALFEVNTTIDQGSAKIKFLYNRHSQHAGRIAAWISNYEHLLLEAIGRLRFAEPELTLADIPQLWATGVTYEGLTRLNRTVVTELGLGGVNEVEAVFPVTPVQQTILVSQARQLQFPAGGQQQQHKHKKSNSNSNNTMVNGNPSAYHIHTMYEFASPDRTPVDLARLVTAWDQVVARHQALRTVFIDSVTEDGLFDAVVLRRCYPNMLFLDAAPGEDPADTLHNLPPLTATPGLKKSVPQHRLTVCHSPMKTVVKLDVSAALCDMMSVNTLMADLRRLYNNSCINNNNDAAVFSYAGYLDIMRGLDRDRSIAWWRTTLQPIVHSPPCLFPRLDFYYGGDTHERARRYDHVRTEIPDVAAHRVAEFCRVHKTTTGTILRLAWGLVLRAVTGANAVCFGYRAPGRSATLEGMRSAAGCFANTMAVSFDLAAYKPVGVLLRQIEDGYNAALPHQHITMAEVRHALRGGGGDGDSNGHGTTKSRGSAAGVVDVQLFNTCFAFTEEPVDLVSSRFAPHRQQEQAHQQHVVELRNVMNHETTDYDMTINTRFSSATGRLVVDLGHALLSETQAHNTANTLGRAVTAILQCASPSEHIGSLDLFSDRDYAQILHWTSPGGGGGGGNGDDQQQQQQQQKQQQQRRLLHELVFDQSIARPISKAVCAHDGDLTYIQIEVLAHRLAHVLLEAGVVPKNGRKAAVPVILDKSKWAPIALLAVLKAGAAFVPIDADEMGFVGRIIEQLGPASCTVALACSAAAATLERSRRNSSSKTTNHGDGNTPPKVLLPDRIVCLDDALMKRLEREAPQPGHLLPPSKPEDLACVFFTPTSSRSVRGISFTHAALSTCFRAQGPAVGIDSTTRVLQLSSFNVDVALAEVFTTLVHGGALCIPTSRDRYTDYTGCVTRFGASWSYMTPLLARKLNVALLPTLRTVCFRTRGLDEDTYAPWGGGRKRVVMAYGAPDVCPLGIAFLEIHGRHHLRAIGTPVAGSAWIVSGENHRNLMPVGAVGEMVIEGPTLGKTFRASSLAGDDGGKELPDTPTSGDHATTTATTTSTPFMKEDGQQDHQDHHGHHNHHRQRPSINTIYSEGGADGGQQGKKRYYKTGHSVRYIEGGLMEYVSSKRDDLEINGRVVHLAVLEQHIRRALGPGIDVMVEALSFKGERGRQPTLAAFLELGSDGGDGNGGGGEQEDQHNNNSSNNANNTIDLTNMSEDVRHRVHVAKQLIEKALFGKVPDFMVPKIFIPVRHLPTTYSLKVNRRKLQKVIKGLSRDQLLQLATTRTTVNNSSHSNDNTTTTVATSRMLTMMNGAQPMVPMTGPEAKIRTIWADVLGVDESAISPGDGFLTLGGDEMSAVRVMVQCRREKMTMAIADLLRNVTLGEWCRGGGGGDNVESGSPFAQVPVTSGQPGGEGGGGGPLLPGQATTTIDESAQTTQSLDTALESAIESIQQQQQQQPPQQHQQPSHVQRTTTITSQMASVPPPPAVATPTPQAIDRAFIDETLADKLLMEPSLIRDVAEATSTQVRHVETAVLTQGVPRMPSLSASSSSASSSPHGTGPASISYFVLHFTAPSSTASVSARRIEEVCHILATIHPILRTAFVAHVEGQTRKLYQVVLKAQAVDFRHIPRIQSWRLAASVDKEIKRDRERLATEHELFARPLTRFLFLDAGKTSALVLRLSRAQYDDQTIALLVKDLKKLYDGGHNPPRRPGFADFVREAALAQVGDEAERYWRGLLDGAVPTQIVRHTKPPKLSSTVRTLRESVAVNLRNLRTATGHATGLAFDTVLKAAWGMVLATVAGTPDVVFGEVVDGCHSRLQQYLGPSSVNRGGVLGPTSTVLPVRIRFADQATSPLKLLQCVAAQRASGVPYENLGMLDIVEKCTPWPYWTRLSTVVQHRADSELLTDGRAKPFRLGQALCRIHVIEGEVVDIPDFLVRSIVRENSSSNNTNNKNEEAFDSNSNSNNNSNNTSTPTTKAQHTSSSFMDGDEQLEISVSFCEQRVPATLAQEVLNKVCGYVRLLTGVSIMQNIVPTAAQYAGLAKQVPLANPVFGSSPTAGVAFNNPFGGGSSSSSSSMSTTSKITKIHANFAQLEAKMSAEQRTTIQATIEDAWRATLDPRTLGVPEEHVTTAAFYDLWGSLLPARALADYLTDMIPLRLAGDLATNLFGNTLDGFVLAMDEIVDHPTMLDQFQLIVRKAFGGEGRERERDRDRGYSSSRNNSLPLLQHSVRKSSSQTSLALSRTGTLHGPSKLGSGSGSASSINGGGSGGDGRKNGHSRNRSDSTGNITEEGGSDSPASKPFFPAHPAVSPPISAHRTATIATITTTGASRKNSDASSATFNSTFTAGAVGGGGGGGGAPAGVGASAAPGSVVTAATSITHTPPSSIGGSISSSSPNPSELPGSAPYHHQHPPHPSALLKRSASIRRAADTTSPESPVLGNAVNGNGGVNGHLHSMMTTSPPVVQTGFVAARKKTNFGIGSSLRRMASNALRPGQQNHNHNNNNSSSNGFGGSSRQQHHHQSHTHNASNLSLSTLAPPKSSGSDMSAHSTGNNSNSRDRELVPPVSPWVRVQSMAPQLPPFSPLFTPVSEDGMHDVFSSSAPSSATSDGLLSDTSPDLSQQQQKQQVVVKVDETSSLSSSPPALTGRISGTLVVGEDGLLFRREESAASAAPGMDDRKLAVEASVLDVGEEDDESESDGEGTLRANQVQKLLATLTIQRHDSPDPRHQQILLQQQQQQQSQRQRHQQKDDRPSPSPVTETFYMEDDEGSSEEDDGVEDGRVMVQGQAQGLDASLYDPYEELDTNNTNHNNHTNHHHLFNYIDNDKHNVDNNNNDDDDDINSAPTTPRPVTMIHSPQQDAPATFGSDETAPPLSPRPKQSPRYSVFPRASISGPPAPAPSPPLNGGGGGKPITENKTTTTTTVVGQRTAGGTDVQDFASLEAAEMDDVVSPLTPVERAMLYKQQGMLGLHHHHRSGGGVVGGLGGSGLGGSGTSRPGSGTKSLTISPLTSPSYFPVQGAEMGGFHAI